MDFQTAEPPSWEVEYTTLKSDQIFPINATQPHPIPLHLLPGYDAQLDFRNAPKGERDEDRSIMERWVRYRAEMKRITPWGMKDLTIGSYVKLARKLVAERKMWNKFSEFM